MADYSREQHKLTVKGVKLNCAVDALPEDKLAIATNVRPTKQGTLTTRPAIASFLKPSSSPIHSIKSFNAAGLNRTFFGAGANLFMDNALVDTGYSGNPLTWASYQPASSVQPFLYVSDSVRYSKVRASDGVRFAVGTPPPGSPPKADIGPPLYSVLSDFDATTGWTAAGGAGTPSAVARVPAGTQTAAVLYDSGSTGWACVAFTNATPPEPTAWLTKGARIIVNTEPQVVSDLIPASITGTTTIAAIQYDAGTTGLCCIVLAKNTSLLERNALLELNAEYVRVLSVSVGEDNSVSFRCVTTGTHAAAETVTVFNTARMYFTGTHTSGESVTGNCLTSAMPNSITVTGTVKAYGTTVVEQQSGYFFNADGSWEGLSITINSVAYVIASVSDRSHLNTTTNVTSGTGLSYSVSSTPFGTLTKTIALDCSQIAGRPITPDDWMHISILVDAPENLLLAQILLDVDATTNDFQHNYYWATITQNVLQAASTGGQSVIAAQQAQVAQETTQAALLAQEIASLGNSQLATGNSAWSEIFIPISQLLAGRVGTDASRTLADVKAIQILISATSALNISIDSWWIGGTYGPNAPESLYPDNPIKYCYRYRSTITGAQSTWSPLTRGGLFPERMQTVVTGACSTDPQVDTVDIARVGASVNGTPQEFASVPNTGSTWSYTDEYADAQLGDQIEQVDFQPWPIQQNPITGTCSVVGTTVFSTSVAIPSNLCVGTEVLINGVATTIRGAPGANGFQISDNIATASGVAFQINSPTTFGNPLPYVTGPYDETLFATGDPVNPGRVYWCNRGNPEGANAANFSDLTNSTEPILGICSWNGYVVPMTANRFFAGTTTNNAASPYSFADTSVGAGLLVPWCFDVGPMIFFLSKNGILATDLGPAKSLSADDLYPFLPHEGQPGAAVNGYSPPNPSVIPRLSFCRDGWLYFDYQTVAGSQYSLAMNTQSPGWWIDTYTPGVALHVQSEVAGSITALVGCLDGSIQQSSTNAADSGGPIACQVRTNAWSFGDFRASKEWGDAFVDCDASGTVSGIKVKLLNDNWAGTLNSVSLTGAQSTTRPPIDINTGEGSLNVNVSLDFTWTGIGTLYGYEITALIEPYTTDQRATDWFDFGGATYVRGIVIMADTFNQAKDLGVENGDNATRQDLQIQNNGQQAVGYAFTPPFVAHTARLLPQDAVPWRFWKVVSWDADKWPELTVVSSPWLNGGALGAKYTRSFIVPMDTNGEEITLRIVTADGQTLTMGPFQTTAAEKTPVPVAFLPPFSWHECQITPSGPCRIWWEEIRWDFDP